MRDPSLHSLSGPSWKDRFLTSYRKRGWRGFTRFYNLLKASAGQRRLQVRTPFGSQFLVSPWDAVDSHVLLEGFYESEVIEALQPALEKPDAVLWVIGANFGLHAVTAKVLYPSTRVVAFEPSPAMSTRILENCDLNQVKIDLHTYALSDTNSVLSFHANASGNPGMSTLHPCEGMVYDHHFSVATFSPANVLERGLAPAPTALLVDAEGAEEEILRGFGQHLAAPKLNSFVFEAANEFLEQHVPTELQKLVTSAGFFIKKLERHENTGHSLSNFLAFRN